MYILRHYKNDGKIVGGEEAEPYSIPYQVKFVFLYFCFLKKTNKVFPMPQLNFF